MHPAERSKKGSRVPLIRLLEQVPSSPCRDAHKKKSSHRSGSETDRATSTTHTPCRHMACLERMGRLMRGDFHIDRCSRQRGLSHGPPCNGHKVAVFGREVAIRHDTETHASFWCAVGLVCRCLLTQECHEDFLGDGISWCVRTRRCGRRSAVAIDSQSLSVSAT